MGKKKKPGPRGKIEKNVSMRALVGLPRRRKRLKARKLISFSMRKAIWRLLGNW